MFNYLTESLWPLVTNAVDLGAALNRWRKFWSVDADFSGVVTISRTPTNGTDAVNKTYADALTPNPTVEEVDGAPSYADSDTIRFDQADGFVITQPGAGIARVDLALTLASAHFANQGTTTTVLHGNAAGNPSWAAVHLVNDVTGIVAEARGGTGVDTSTSTGVPVITAGAWTVPAQVAALRGGTGIDTSASTGVPRISAGAWTVVDGQIPFPAAQNASADANTLDDYEEGTWTPVLTFATPGDLVVAYGAQAGAYTKIGRLILLTCRVGTTTFTHTTASGACQVTGFPFTGNGAVEHHGSLSWQGITKVGFTEWVPRFNGPTTTVDFMGSGSGQVRSQLAVGDMPTGGTVELNFTLMMFV